MSTHRAALADPLFYSFKIDTGAKIFKDFFTACRTRRPIKKVLPPAWDVDKVLRFLRSPQFANNATITTPALLLKTIFLLALASGSRVSELAALRRDKDHCQFLENNKGINLSTKDGVLFKSERLLKQNPVLFIPSLKNKKHKTDVLCPVNALKHWLSRTDKWENPQSVIWFNAATKRPGNARLLSLRFKKLIQLAYTEKVSAKFHDIRKAATSLAFNQGLSISQVCARANWAGESVFFKSYFYKNNTNLKCISLSKRINKNKK